MTHESADLDLSNALAQALLFEEVGAAGAGTEGVGKKEGGNKQEWEFSYGEKALLRGNHARNDEEKEEPEDEDEGEENGECVRINTMSKWRADGQLVRGRHQEGDQKEDMHEEEEEGGGEEEEQEQQEEEIEDFQKEEEQELQSLDESFESHESTLLTRSKVGASSVRESQDFLRNREAADAEVCWICGEFGHGIRDCPYKEPEVGEIATRIKEKEESFDVEEESQESTGVREEEELMTRQQESEKQAHAQMTATVATILHDIIQLAMDTNEEQTPVAERGKEEELEVSRVINEVIQSQITTATSESEQTDKRAAAAVAEDWRKIENELEAKHKEAAQQAAAEQEEFDELALRRRQDEAERMALARTAIMMQKLFRGKQARGFARDLREIRALQLRRFVEEAKKNARTGVLELKRSVPLQVLGFKHRFNALVDQAVANYKENSSSIMAVPDKMAITEISEEIFALWAGASIENEKAIATALVNSARTEVWKGLVHGRVMKGALERDSLVKGLDKINSIAQDSLSAALREHLPLSPETVEERMASLKVSIEAKKRLQAHVEIECDKVMREMEELTRPIKPDVAQAPTLMGMFAGADPGSALRQWAPLSHLPGDLNGRMLKSRERATTKESIRDRSRACQRRWQALEVNLDNSRIAFTNSILGISNCRGWDCVPALEDMTPYAISLRDALSYLSPPSSATDPNAPRPVIEAKILRRRVADVFAPKLVMKGSRNEILLSVPGVVPAQGRELPWPEWEPGKFRRKHEDARYSKYTRKVEPHFVTKVVLGSPESPVENQYKELKDYSVLPRIVAHNFDHVLGNLGRELGVRREDRDLRLLRHPSSILRDERWQHIRDIREMKPEAFPAKELFATPRRQRRWRDHVRHAEAQETASVVEAGGGGYAVGGRDSVLSMLSGGDTRAHSRLTIADCSSEHESTTHESLHPELSPISPKHQLLPSVFQFSALCENASDSELFDTPRRQKRWRDAMEESNIECVSIHEHERGARAGRDRRASGRSRGSQGSGSRVLPNFE